MITVQVLATHCSSGVHVRPGHVSYRLRIHQQRAVRDHHTLGRAGAARGVLDEPDVLWVDLDTLEISDREKVVGCEPPHAHRVEYLGTAHQPHEIRRAQRKLGPSVTRELFELGNIGRELAWIGRGNGAGDDARPHTAEHTCEELEAKRVCYHHAVAARTLLLD
eukprot:scaffold6942_cov72-Phaeocystis_antarctica.AAC.7